jgi:hypothetical protein
VAASSIRGVQRKGLPTGSQCDGDVAGGNNTKLSLGGHLKGVAILAVLWAIKAQIAMQRCARAGAMGSGEQEHQGCSCHS